MQMLLTQYGPFQQQLSRREAWLAVQDWYRDNGFDAAADALFNPEIEGAIDMGKDPYQLLGECRIHSIVQQRKLARTF